MKTLASIAACLAALVLGARSELRAQATVLLEEPYSYDGTFAGTGHTAIYLSRVCAESPTLLRRCRPGETGVVISRYHGIAGHDWIAIPLIPYLYAVQDTDSIPLVVDRRVLALLRERYLSTLPLPPEKSPGAEPRYELAGSAYDRTLYGFQFATRPEQDDKLIEMLNASPNRESYELVKRNCADFVKQIVNFYYPRAIHRSVIADMGVTTPKQDAKSLVHHARHHPEMQLTSFIVQQVPGLKRSKSVHGLIESLVLAKKYATPALVFHPFVAGTIEAAYWAGGRFNPSKGALIFDAADNATPSLERPLTSSERRSYEGLVASRERQESEGLPSWWKLDGKTSPQLDAQGHPFVDVRLEGRDVPVGLCRANALRLSSSPELVEDIVLARMQIELKSSKPARISSQEVKSDWKLLQAAQAESRASLNDDVSAGISKTGEVGLVQELLRIPLLRDRLAH